MIAKAMYRTKAMNFSRESRDINAFARWASSLNEEYGSEIGSGRIMSETGMREMKVYYK
jgi:hypothetical protein